MARKQKHEEHENHERWLVSYADFITLLFAFFVVMYSLSAVNEGKFRVLSESLIAAFKSPPKSLRPVQSGQPTKSPAPIMNPEPVMAPALITRPPGKDSTETEFDRERMKAINEMAEQIERAMKPLIDADLVSVRRDALWIEVEIKTSILFPSGSAALGPQALPVLRKISDILSRFTNQIHVEGYTDNVPISTLAFPSNWELSAARAASVVHLFSAEGIRPERMAAIGFGEYRPIADNAREDGRNKNRRVVLVIMSDGRAKDILGETQLESAERVEPAPRDAGAAEPAHTAPEVKPAARPEVKPAVKVETRPEVKPAVKPVIRPEVVAPPVKAVPDVRPAAQPGPETKPATRAPATPARNKDAVNKPATDPARAAPESATGAEQPALPSFLPPIRIIPPLQLAPPPVLTPGMEKQTPNGQGSAP